MRKISHIFSRIIIILKKNKEICSSSLDYLFRHTFNGLHSIFGIVVSYVSYGTDFVGFLLTGTFFDFHVRLKFILLFSSKYL